MRLLLSHPITAQAPGWPGNNIYEVTRVRSTANGDINNSCIFRMHEHFGTHFDAPFHFNPNGPSITELPFDYFFFQKPVLVEIPKGAYEKLEPTDFEPFAKLIAQADLLLIRTGFEAMRDADPQLYQMGCPAVTPAAAQYLVENFGSALKAICLDFMSLASPSDKSDAGAQAHRHMLGVYSQDFICVIEDASLAAVPANAKLENAAAIPLMLTGIDSSPVTVWVETAD